MTTLDQKQIARELTRAEEIVLLHDTQEAVIRAFPRMIDAVHTRSCELLERGEGEELWDVVGDPRLFFQPRDGAAPQRASRPVSSSSAPRRG